MARLVGVDLPRDKRLEVALTYIFGIGKTRAFETLTATGVSGDTRVHQLSDEDIIRLRDWIEANYKVEGDLRREVQADIRRKVEIGCYQGLRPRRGLRVNAPRKEPNRRQESTPQGTEEHRSRARPHQEHVQQHHRVHHRPGGKRDRLGFLWP